MVNVIIVDFRALDTLGEIAVVMAAGLAILVLLKMRAEGHGAVPASTGGAGIRPSNVETHA